LGYIKEKVENYIAMHRTAMSVVCAAQRPEEVLSFLEEKPEQPGLYFLDVHLKATINGLDLGAAIRQHDPRAFIVYITSDAESHRLTFKHRVEAMDYIVKSDPHMEMRIYECIEDSVAKLVAAAHVHLDNFVLKLSDDISKYRGGVGLSNGSVVTVACNQIIYFMSESNLKRSIIVYTTDGRMQLHGSLTKVEKELNKEYFYRCQGNLIVNLDKVLAVDPKQKLVHMDGGHRLELALRKIKALVKRVEVRKTKIH